LYIYDGVAAKVGPTPSFSLNEWTNLCFTYDAVNDVVTGYADGVAGTPGTSADYSAPATRSLYISGPTNEVDGVMDNVAIWGRVLTADEINRMAEDPALVPIRQQ
jgi:hypothetical protein